MEIELRDIGPGDAEDAWKWASDPEVTRYLSWEPYEKLGDLEEYLARVAEKHSWFKAICVEGRPVGSISMHVGKGFSACTAELGYVIARDFWNRGIGSTTLRRVAEIAFDEFGVSRVQARVNPENIGSARALEKAGFELEGRLRKSFLCKGVVQDVLLYAAVSET